MKPPTIIPVADHALLIEFATEINDGANRAVVALDRTLAADPPLGFLEAVPAFVSLLVTFDPLLTDHDELTATVRSMLKTVDEDRSTPATHRVPVCYEASFAPDLGAVAAAANISQQTVIDAHLGGDYRVVMYGFAPGYAYMAGVPPVIQLPRKPAAVRGVPSGSVIIAGPQCLITTLDMPTGWSIIGRTPTRVLRPASSSPFLFDIGDRVEFERIDLATYDMLMAAAQTAQHEQP